MRAGDFADQAQAQTNTVHPPSTVRSSQTSLTFANSKLRGDCVSAGRQQQATGDGSERLRHSGRMRPKASFHS